MILTVCSEQYAIEIAKTTKKDTAIVSITCPEDPDIIFTNNESIKSIFRMKFNDIDTDKIPNLPPPKRDDFIGLKDFADNLCCEELIVHCGAGVSRSAAVAAALNEYLHLGYTIFGREQYHPNSLVYKYACIELGIIPNRDAEDYFMGVF